MLDLFDKCRQFDLALESARAHSRFFYSRAITPAAAPVAMRNGRELINLGSNNHLGLTEHPKVKAAARAPAEQFGTGSAGRPSHHPYKPDGHAHRGAVADRS